MAAIKIYQLQTGCYYLFEPWNTAKKLFNINDYDVVEEFELQRHGNEDADPYKILEDLYVTYNIHRPDHFKGHSMSVSDVVGIDGTLYYCDSTGWVKLSL